VHAVAFGAESMIDEELIGFDAREAGEYDPRWDDKRRQRFLLRHEVARPLSLDLDVWPTVFDIGSLETTSRFARERGVVGGICWRASASWGGTWRSKAPIPPTWCLSQWGGCLSQASAIPQG
jgi:hypothetical protein